MKKFLNFSAVLTVILLQSCEEKGVLIDFGDKRDIYDTTYVGAVETAQARKVLLEEFTGASCTNCPQGHVTVASILSNNPDRVVAIAYHTFNGGKIFKPVDKPGEKSKYDFRDSAATNIGEAIYGGLNSIPKAGVDRMVVGTSRQLDRAQWTLQTENRLKAGTPANLYVTSTYEENGTEKKVRVSVKVAYTKAVTTKNTLTIGVIENGIIDLQEYPDSVAHHYDHEHVFRKCLTPFYGNTVLDSLATKEPGRVYEYTYTFVPADAWKLENCKIIAILSNNESDNKEVLQAAEVKLK